MKRQLAQEIGDAVAEAIAGKDGPTQRELNGQMNERLRSAANVGTIEIEIDAAPSSASGHGLDQGARSGEVGDPDPHATMNDAMRRQLGFIGGDS